VNVLLALVLVALGAPPEAGPAAMTMTGSLDKEVIRRVIRSHLDEVKYCYERELAKMPDLFGTVWVEFSIEATGEVSVSTPLTTSTTRQAPLESCVAAAVKRWRFPETGGGGVLVKYPFVLTPAARAIPIVNARDGTRAFEITVVDSTAVVHTSTNAQGIPSNGLIAVLEKGLLLVDTAWTDAQTEAILDWGDRRLGRPWIGAVITHDHADRDGGLGALQRRHIPVAALDLTIAKLEKRGVHGVTRLFTAQTGEFKDPRGFEAFYPGPGHAPDNIVLVFHKVLFAGCFIKSMEAKELGFTGDADLAHWPESIRHLMDRYDEVEVPVVPGHGAVGTDANFQHTLDLLAAAGKK
jgi:metallo-beta-lactamase class B